MSNLLKLTEITDLRSVWKHEAYDFSKWLSQPDWLEELGNAIGLSLIEPQTEVGSGKFSIDILAIDENTGKKVVIENQLEATDHDHLGKIITYSSGVGAESVIWIVKRAQIEHQQAINWLNENTGEGVNFFLIEIKLFQIGNSQLAPKFDVLCKPNNWQKIVKQEGQGELKERHLNRLDFWQQFIDSSGSIFKNRKAVKDHWLTVAAGSSKYHISFCTSKMKPTKGASVEFVMKNIEDYEALFLRKDELETELGFTLNWVASGRMCFVQSNHNIFDKAKWKEIFDFYLKYYPIFKNVIPKYLDY